MDYKEEQRNEIAALESIYCGELEILETEPFDKFAITINSEEYEPETGNGVSCRLEFTYTPKYPEEPLLISIDSMDNFDKSDEENLMDCLNEEMKQNLGMVMAFTLISTTQEWLNNRWDKVKFQKRLEADRKLLQEEIEERKRFEGTRVTVETFMKWKDKFEDEMGFTKRKELAEKEAKKLTGRELFMIDKSLDQSDLKFLDDGDNVKVDESLFQNLDDLDLDDDEDDPDYNPYEDA